MSSSGSIVPKWVENPPTVEECEQIAREVLDRGYVITTVVGQPEQSASDQEEG